MKRTILFLTLPVLIFSTRLSGQVTERALMKIDGREIPVEEFLRVYNKNNNVTAESEKKSIDEYLDLFINYKLKVVEAENLGYDTVKSFLDEFTGYRDQLAGPYLKDKNLKEKLIQEAYERSKYDVRASHILIKVDEKAAPADTLKTYKKITDIRARILAGEPFEEISKVTSEDKSAADNGGDLGYFSVFRMVYPFETGAYTTPVGGISQPVRTRFGYHLIKVVDIRPNRGSVRVAHIMTRIPSDASAPEKNAAREKIEQAKKELLSGASWNEVVQKYSENSRTRSKNGDVGWIEAGRAPDEFLNACFTKEVGQYTDIIETEGAYHIALIQEKKTLEPFELAYDRISGGIDRDNERQAAMKLQNSTMLKNKYGYKEFEANIAQLIPFLDSSIYTKSWNPVKAANLIDPVVIVGSGVYTIYDYAVYISKLTRFELGKKSFTAIVNGFYAEYANKCLIDYATEQLPKENADYKYLVQEYHDGILLFNLTNDKVWKKAQQDTTGLEAFYNKAPKYTWNERIDVIIYEYTNEKLTANLPKIAKSHFKKNLSDSVVIKQICATDSVACVKILKKTYEKGHDAICDKLTWKKGAATTISENGKNYFYYVTGVHPVENKKLSDARGLYIADYQTYLEKEWVNSLREKYPVEMNTEVLETLKTELNQ